MTETRVKISSIISNQLPEFVREEFPLVVEFLKEYYSSTESQGSSYDLIQNIDKYVKLDSLSNLVDSTTLSSDVSFFDSTIQVESTYGFPDSYGLLLIDDEIITYKGKTQTTFTGCIRGFSGVKSLRNEYNKDELVFVETDIEEHFAEVNGVQTEVVNLSILFLKEFFSKIKRQVSPGFEDREFYKFLNENVFIKQSSDFYKTKGTKESFRILFNSLYGNSDDSINSSSKFQDVIIPSKYVIEPSSADYRTTQDLVVESIEGDPLDLINRTLIQRKLSGEEARGTITNVQKITRDNKNIGTLSYTFDNIPSKKSPDYFLREYYVISLDYEYSRDILTKDYSSFIQGYPRELFSIDPKTKITSQVLKNQTFIDVDSTVGFPEQGILIVDLSNGTTLTIEYTSKNLNQFLGCKNITQEINQSQEVKLNTYAYSLDDSGNEIQVRITGIVEDYSVIGSNLLHSENSPVLTKTLGDDLSGPKADKWLLNIPNWYDVEKIEKDTSSTYILRTIDPHKFNILDKVYLKTTFGELITIDSDITVTSVKSENEIIIETDFEIDLEKKYRVYRKISKLNYYLDSDYGSYPTNVLNLYSNSTDVVYTTSLSFPSYIINATIPSYEGQVFSDSIDGKLVYGVEFSSEHYFYDGDHIVVKNINSDFDFVIGYVKKLTNKKIRISNSPSNIFKGDYLNLQTFSSSTVKVEYFKFNSVGLGSAVSKKLEPQNLIREFEDPVNDLIKHETKSGPIGIFVNGVEILNYKTEDFINYGKISEIKVVNSGRDYDVINPPILSITDRNGFGSGASAKVSVKGSLERIDIIDPGHNYKNTPKIEITGGNGKNAEASANLVSYDHYASFNSANISTNTIEFIENHKFSSNEEVLFVPNKFNSISGLSTNSIYYVSVVDPKKVKLHNTFSDSVNGINPITLSPSSNSSIHQFKSFNKKRKVQSITVINPGEGYTNRHLTVNPVGINTYNNTINIKNHRFNSGEIVVYHSTEQPISGLTSSSNYYVKKLDDNNFRLYNTGSSSSGLTTNFYYETDQYIKFNSSGVGTHIFNYPEIKVKITGDIDVSVSSGQSISDFECKIQPIFRGEIEDVYLESEGINYGSDDILNLDRKPLVELNSGKNGEIDLIINNGKIESAIVKNIGQDYNSPPTIEIRGDGAGASISPIVDNEGRLIDLYISSKGDGYTPGNTSAFVVNAGTGANLIPFINSWNINKVERIFNEKESNNTSAIPPDDGFLEIGLNKLGLQYFHLYASRELRKSLPISLGDVDLTFTDNEEQPSQKHSPIIGWAYDGNPIYGPYGFRNSNGTGGIKLIKSGYELKSDEELESEQRPSTDKFRPGIFVEDYKFTNSGDLDEHNGRFCITPDFPNGVYAYFCTISEENSPIFDSRYRKPEFPYVIGNSFNSKPIDFNLKTLNDHNNIDFSKLNTYRNSNAYNIKKNNSGYDYFLNYDDSVTLEVNSIESGSIESVGVITGGINYRVGDKILVDNLNSEGKNFDARVSFIQGKEVQSISFASTSIKNVEFLPLNGRFIGISSDPHTLFENDVVTISSPYELPQIKNIDLTKNILRLKTGLSTVTSTGIVTYLNVYGDLSYPSIIVDDVYLIGENEKVKVIEIDEVSSRIRVIRNWDGTTSGITSHPVGIALTEQTRKLFTNIGVTSQYNWDYTRKLYINPAESVGLGTVGITSTVYISNPGVGNTYISLPLRTIYIKSHNLKTGDKLIYQSNGGTSISVSTDTNSSFTLENNSIVYAAKINDNLIGISTVKVRINSVGEYVGVGTISGSILYFTGIGTGTYHSFTTIPENNLSSEIEKNTVTVSVAQSHGLSLRNQVKINVNSGISTSISIKYDDFSRRIIVDSQNISDIDTTRNTLEILNHNFKTGEKVIFKETSSISGLVDNEFYYVTVYDSDNIKLSSTKYNLKNRIYIDINSTGSGSISKINPSLRCYKNQLLRINLNDLSLSYRNSSGTRFPAFEFSLYTDSSYIHKYDTFKRDSSGNRIIRKFGTIGIDGYIEIKISNETPKELYYNLIPLEDPDIPTEKKELLVDDEQIFNNKLVVVQSKYNGIYSILDIEENSFTYSIADTVERSSYNSSEAEISYSTNSNLISGPISEIKLINGGENYKSLPSSVSIDSQEGDGALLELRTNNIGKIGNVKINNYGFDYSIDSTLSPKVIYPTILKLSTLSKIDSIEVKSLGVGYNVNPDLLMFDGLTGELVNDILLSYSIEDQKVTILENTSGINNVTPKILPINNSNGIGIDDITYDYSSGITTVYLTPEFSDPEDFPFEVGSKVLVEGVNVSASSTSLGYNSENYNFSLFTLVGVDTNLGGANASITYDMSEFLDSQPGFVPGEYDALTSNGSVVPEKFFPTFDIQLKKTDFFRKELVVSGNSSGIVEYWDNDNSYLSVSSVDDFSVDDVIIGRSSKTKSIIKEVNKTYGYCDIKSFSVVDKGWVDEKGFLNNAFQRIHDSDYYQYFSYSIKSEVPIDTWDNPVSSLNHTAGFKKFSDLVVRSKDDQYTGIATNQNEGAFTAVSNLYSVIDLDCYNYFDYGFENYEKIGNSFRSSQIIFDRRKIQDYIEAKSNRVLLIDDISDQFKSNNILKVYSDIDSFNLTDIRHIKYFLNIKNRNFENESEFSIVSVFHDNNNSYLNEYGEIFSTLDVGYFGLFVNSDENLGYLRFYPTSPYYNDFDIDFIAFSLNDSLSGISTQNIGDIASINTHNTILPLGTSSETNIVSISSTYRSAKICVLFGSNDDEEYEYSEFNLIHNDSDVFLVQYGALESDELAAHSGLGTFGASLSGSDINISFTPYVSLGSTYYTNSYSIGIGTTASTVSDQINIGDSYIKSSYVAISSSPTPSPVAISSNTSFDQSSYFILSIEDTTNNKYQFTELISHYNKESEYINWSEYGNVETDGSLGILTCGILNNEKSVVYFTPNENIDCEVRLFELSVNEFTVNDEIDLSNGKIYTNNSRYLRNQLDISKSFELKHNGYDIFSRTFNPQQSNIIDIQNDIINIENHFFSNGEEITYEYIDGSPIGIATTTVPGIGSTDKLPSTLYVIKVSDNQIRVSASSTDSLSFNINYFDLQNTGIGTDHRFISKKQNTKCLITIDNVIQSPVVSTSKTTEIISNVSLLTNEFFVSDPKNIQSGDFLRINDEIIRVSGVGIGTTNNIIADRAVFGTGIQTHSTNDEIVKLDGNYNIIDNTLYFSEPPYGLVPEENPEVPDETDYTGLQISSKFSGRVFLRSGVPDTDIDAYENNYIFDSLTEDFNGIDTEFTLTENGQNITGFSTNNSVVLLRSVFQQPQRVGGSVPIQGIYTINEDVGITTITFTGNDSISSNDINTVDIPRGGIIISVGSTEGFGYQPLVSAGGSAIVSAAGTIQSISIGNSGSGYRVGIQTYIRVGVQTESSGVPKIEFIGTASVSNGHIVGVSITNPGIGYTTYQEIFTTNVSENVSVGSTIIPVDSLLGISSLNYVSIGNSIFNARIVGVGTTSILIGTGSTISTTIPSGTEVVFKEYNPPKVIFDDPLSYSNIPLIYSSDSSSGVGTLATVNLIVSQDSSVLSFELNNTGYGYEPGEILTVDIGGLTGIPTNTTLPFREFQIEVGRIYNDSFYGWTMGALQVFDPIDNLIDGVRKVFPLRINNEQISIESAPTSSIDLKSTLLIFIDDILQVPGESYVFNGGSIIRFIQPPNKGSTSKIIFYRGTDNVDSYDVDILETVKVGDRLRLSSPSYSYDTENSKYNFEGNSPSLNEDLRIVNEIISSDIARTNNYSGVGINSDQNILRSITWCKQRNDLFVEGIKISKSRLSYEPLIYPTTNIIQNVGIDTTEIFVESLKTFFDSFDEYYPQTNDVKEVEIISQDEIESALATVTVSSAGTIQSINLINGGKGYSENPVISIGNPVGYGTTATAIASVTSGVVTSITLTNPGFGYTTSNNVPILIEPPKTKRESIRRVTYEGDFGIITGIASTSIVGVASTGLWLDLYIPADSFVRDLDINNVGIATTGISGIQTGYYFSLYGSVIGNGTISYRSDGSVIGVGTTYIDNVYQVLDYKIEEANVAGVGLTYVNKVLVQIDSFDNVGIGEILTFDSTYYSWDSDTFSFDSQNDIISSFANYSWGRISFSGRNVNEFNWYGENGIGINTSPIVRRVKPLRYKDYRN